MDIDKFILFMTCGSRESVRDCVEGIQRGARRNCKWRNVKTGLVGFLPPTDFLECSAQMEYMVGLPNGQ